MENRWVGLLPSQVEPQEKMPTVEDDSVEVLRGAGKPHVGLSVPTGAPAEEVLSDGSGLHWLGAHGGSGETTLATLLGGRACEHLWPRLENSGGEAIATLLVARRNHSGMQAASAAARRWASGAHEDVALVGLVLVDDAPGKVPRELQRQAKVLSGAVPRTWVIPWIEDLRVYGETEIARLSHAAAKPLAALREVVEEHTPANERKL